MNEIIKEKVINEVVDNLLKIKKPNEFYNINLLKGLVLDANGFLKDDEVTEVCIDVSDYVGREYNICGCD